MNPTDIKNPEYFHKVIDCQFACPAHTQVPEYIRLIAQKKYAEAYMINWESNVFPGILGRVCDRPCEPACRRGRVEEKAVAICRLKRVCADNKGNIKNRFPEIPKKKNGKKIALIGGGPASLTVARDLLPLGYSIDLYDDQAEAGGFVRSQVPSFRLPKKVLDEEVNTILNMGVKTYFNTYISSLKNFLKKDYDAIFIGTGAPRGRDLDLPGRQAGKAFIHIGIQWLASVQYGHIKKAGKTTLVIGGGNTAMDCCRTARRLGGETVKVIIRGSREKMKASAWEIEDALREDIPIMEHLSPMAFVVEEGRLTGLSVQKVSENSGSGQKPIFIPCDEVLLAVGQQNAFPWIEKDVGLVFDDSGRPQVDDLTFQSNIKKIFFGGDAAFGPKNVITAVAHGHKAAISMDLFCRGKDLTKRPVPGTTLDGQKMGFHDWIYHNEVSDRERQNVPMVPKVKSIKDRLMEVELGFDRKIGFTEARRCINCDIQTVFTARDCIECDACVDVCPTTCINFIKNSEEDELRTRLAIPANNRSQSLYVSDILPTGRVMVKDENVCLHCGLCAERCPTAAWDMQKYTYTTAKAGQE
ncbi:MAG: FAD-dependent oxidoreductase [Proteobacteria bacterium]|nr:FAD-dependent oxidoreductase [Pseudomonadota bacterium]MBU1584101.1 FAD-dependent oxidoreductase [Pseudomonadota bacterium]MBU2629170.1 FAD-dependent oxidoreductase [Pseudomonadota bacterium]